METRVWNPVGFYDFEHDMKTQNQFPYLFSGKTILLKEMLSIRICKVLTHDKHWIKKKEIILRKKSLGGSWESYHWHL